MNGFFFPIALPRKAPALALALLAAVWLPDAGTAEAADCPSGQIFRVSKQVCIDRAEAVTLGIVKAGPGKRAPSHAAKAAPETDAAADPAADAKPEAAKPAIAPRRARAKKPDVPPPAAPDMRDADAEVSAPPPVLAPPPVAAAPTGSAPSRPVIVHTVPVTVGPTPPAPAGATTPSASPFGALNVENFAKP